MNKVDPKSGEPGELYDALYLAKRLAGASLMYSCYERASASYLIPARRTRSFVATYI